MMWLLDTNALIHLDKKRGSFLKSARDIHTCIYSIIEYPVAMKYPNIALLFPKTSTYSSAIEYSGKLREAGVLIPCVDILIATLAVENNLPLVSDDEHLEHFHSIEPRLNTIGLDAFLGRITVSK
jgi:predicted nucleic acid-binding protein